MGHIKLFEAQSRPYRRINSYPEDREQVEMRPGHLRRVKSMFAKLGIDMETDSDETFLMYDSDSLLAPEDINNAVYFQKQYRQKDLPEPTPLLWVLVSMLEGTVLVVSVAVKEYDFDTQTIYEHSSVHFSCDNFDGLQELVDGPVTKIDETLGKVVDMRHEAQVKTKDMMKGLSRVGGR